MVDAVTIPTPRAAGLHRHWPGREPDLPIVAISRSADQPILMTAAFGGAGDIKRRLVSVGRYSALHGTSHTQELFTLDPDS
jgi:hypothetical protein